jgi:hypothetical protein
MTTKAKVGYGVLLEHGDGAGPEVFSAIAGVTKITGPGWKLDMEDSSDMQSASAHKEFIPGLVDAGEIQVEGNFLGTGATEKQNVLITELTGRTIANYKILPPGSDTTFTSIAFAAYVSEFQPSFDKSKPRAFSAKLKISGPVTIT